MIDIRLRLAADEFTRYLKSSGTVKEFQTAKRQIENDQAIAKMRREYTLLATSYQEKERGGTLTQDDISKLRGLQKTFNAHPATVRYSSAQQSLIILLRHCSAVINEDLGFDFAATAAPAKIC